MFPGDSRSTSVWFLAGGTSCGRVPRHLDSRIVTSACQSLFGVNQDTNRAPSHGGGAPFTTDPAEQPHDGVLSTVRPPAQSEGALEATEDRI